MTGITASGLRKDVESMIDYGATCRFRYFNVSTSGTDYDDATTITQSGNDIWVSGLQQPIKDVRGSYEAMLLEQGKINQNDSILYVKGNLNTSGLVEIGIGSPPSSPTNIYALIENGVTPWKIGGEIVYKKLFVRQINNGSFYSI